MTGTALGAFMHISRGSLLHTPPSPASSSAPSNFGGHHAHVLRHSNKRQRLMRPERHAVVAAAAVEQAPKSNKQGSRARNGNGGSNGASTQGIVGKIPEEAEPEFADGSVIKVGCRRESLLLSGQPLASPGTAERAADTCGLLFRCQQPRSATSPSLPTSTMAKAPLPISCSSRLERWQTGTCRQAI